MLGNNAREKLLEKLEDMFHTPIDLVEIDQIRNPYFKEAVDETKVPVYEIASGSREQAEKRAASFAGQLGLYSRAITAAKGWKLLSAWIHLPVSGLVVRVLPD